MMNCVLESAGWKLFQETSETLNVLEIKKASKQTKALAKSFRKPGANICTNRNQKLKDADLTDHEKTEGLVHLWVPSRSQKWVMTMSASGRKGAEDEEEKQPATWVANGKLSLFLGLDPFRVSWKLQKSMRVVREHNRV